jgi:predicted enzyme related to lactoylglutathione lyase
MGRLVHFEILTEDPQKAVDFYKSVFNWEIATWGGGEESYWQLIFLRK